MSPPGPPKLWLWLGLALVLAGVVVSSWAYTGDRAYEIAYVGVAVVGFLLVVGGSWMAGWAQAERPRLGDRRAARKDRGDPDDRDKPGLVERLKAALPGRGRGAEAVDATVACPSCRTVFEARGAPPFEAICPECGHEDRVDLEAAQA